MKTKKSKPHVTIAIPIEVAETLEGLIDGCIGTSEDDDFNYEMKIVLSQLKTNIKKYYSNINKT